MCFLIVKNALQDKCKAFFNMYFEVYYLYINPFSDIQKYGALI